LDKIGVTLDARGRVVTDTRYKTNISGIWAMCDCREGAMLAHKAEDEAVACAENIGRSCRPCELRRNSGRGLYGAGSRLGRKTEEELKASGIVYKVGKFPFSANARAKTIAATEGFAKVIADAKQIAF